MIESQLRRIAVSQGSASPTGALLTLLTADATRLWKDIPTESIPDAVDEGLTAAGTFPCNAGIVAKAWRDRKPSGNRYLGAGRMNEQETLAYIRWLENPNRDEPNGEARAKLGGAG